MSNNNTPSSAAADCACHGTGYLLDRPCRFCAPDAANAGEPAAITVAKLAKASDRKAPPIMRALNVFGGDVTLNQPLDLALIGAALCNAGCRLATPTGVAADESTRAPDGFGLELTAEEMKRLIEFAGADDPSAVVLRTGDGHSGPGLYAWLAEYPDEGSMFLGVEAASGERPSAPAPEVQGFGRIVGTLAKQPGARIDWPALPDASAPASAPLPLTDEDFWLLAMRKCGVLHSDVLHMSRKQVVALGHAIARECLAAAPVADERAKLRAALQEATDALAGGLWDYGPGQDEHAKCNEVIQRCRAALSGGSPEPVSGSEGEEEGAGR